MSAPPFKVKAIYEYVSEHGDDLQFPVGQIITVTELEGDDWYVGEYSEAAGIKKEGLFPANFVEKYEPEVPLRPSRPSRPKQESQTPAPSAVVPPIEEEEKKEEPKPAPPAPTVDASPTEVVRDVPPKSPPQTVREPPATLKPAPVEPAQQIGESSAPAAKKAPPPIAAKSNAFKDRIAAFNQPAAAPVAPSQSGRKVPANDFIKKPFVAPPPSKNAYIPPPKATPVQKPYHREEDPEIKQRQDEDQAAAEAAGLTNESSGPVQNEDEDEPKPMTLKERMALLQQQQQEQAQRRAETVHKKKPPPRKPSGSESGAAGEGGEADGEQPRDVRSPKQSLDIPRMKPPVPLAQDSPEGPSALVAEPEILSDSHDADQSGAGELTEDDSGTLGPHESDEQPVPLQRRPSAPTAAPGDHEADDATERDDGAEEDGEDSMDEEERRKQALRARMARLGGAQAGMGAMLGFGAPLPTPPKKRSTPKDLQTGEEAQSASPPEQQQRIAMVPIPGMPRMQSPESDATRGQHHDEEEEEADEEQTTAPPPPRRSLTSERAAPPPVPKDSRPLPPPPTQEPRAPPPVPSAVRPSAPESRPVPPPPPAAITSPGPGSESDDELSMHAKPSSAENSGVETPLPIRPVPPPVPGPRDVPPRPVQSPGEKRLSYFSGSEPASATSDKRASRAIPPVPGSPNLSRPPPPPPPTQGTTRRQSTMGEGSVHDNDEERISSDYDGDYDTDIASSAKHKDALKAPHNREPSLTDSPSVADDEYSAITPTPTTTQAAAPRAVPPPPPQATPKSRPSMDRPPPPVPPPREIDDPDYDPYRYPHQDRAVPAPPGAIPTAAPPVPPPRAPDGSLDESSADELYEEPQQSTRRSTERTLPPPPQEKVLATALSHAPLPRQSLDVGRSGTMARRSMEQGRPTGEHGQIANDIDLGTNTTWWTAEKPLPPVFQSRAGIDLLSECEESSKSKRGGRKEITKDIYVLFMDYSQTVISARYDSQDPTDVVLQQRHEPPPAKLRQDQLEAAWQRFGKSIAEAAHAIGNSKKDSTVGDGAPATLPFELIKARPDALLPVGVRAYGALVYSNLANASTMQFDEIRPGDIITVRNARFEGHHGAMKSKYKADYGPSHVAIVEEWDGTKRAVRAWEQGRDKKGGVRSEKFRLGDLRSGEVRVWRVVGRSWVGWDS